MRLRGVPYAPLRGLGAGSRSAIMRPQTPAAIASAHFVSCDATARGLGAGSPSAIMRPIPRPPSRTPRSGTRCRSARQRGIRRNATSPLRCNGTGAAGADAATTERRPHGVMPFGGTRDRKPREPGGAQRTYSSLGPCVEGRQSSGLGEKPRVEARRVQPPRGEEVQEEDQGPPPAKRYVHRPKGKEHAV